MPGRELSKKELEEFEELELLSGYGDPEDPDFRNHIIAALQFNGMPSIDTVALKVKNALKKAFKNNPEEDDEYEYDDKYEYRKVALNALNFNPLVKNFKNIVAWIGGSAGYTDPNAEHPGYFKGIKLFCEDMGIDENDVIEYFLDTATYMRGYYTGDNIYNL